MNALRVTTIAAFLAVAPLSAAVAASDDVESDDAMMARESPTPSVTSSPKAGEANEEHGAGSGEPESKPLESTPPKVQPEDEFLKSVWTMP
jgi:hypothetical protein